MIIKNLKKYFSFEVTVLDDKGIKRRFRASNYQARHAWGAHVRVWRRGRGVGAGLRAGAGQLLPLGLGPAALAACARMLARPCTSSTAVAQADPL